MADKMIYCKTCGKEMAKNATVCPNCGAKNKKNNVFSIIGIIFVVIFAVGVIGGLTSDNSNSKGSVVDPAASYVELVEETASRGLEVENGVDGITIEKEAYTWYFKGTVINNKTSDLSYAQVEINLYDADGALLGTAMDNVNNLKAGGKWKFKAMTLLSQDELKEVASWELGDVTGW